MPLPHARWQLAALFLALTACAANQAPSVDDSGSDPHAPDEDAGEPDTPRDAGELEDASDTGDASDDAGDASDDELWQDCPTSDDYVGPGAGVHALVATAAARYCARFDESRSLKQELAAKAMLRIVPRKYFLRAEGRPAYALPLCLRTQAAPHPGLEGQGTLEHSQAPYLGGQNHRYTWTQPVTRGTTSLQLRAQFDIHSLPNRTPTLTLDGKHPALDAVDAGGRFEIRLCEDANTCFPAWHFDSCDFADSAKHVHEVTLERGSVKLELNIGESFASTEPGAFARASGNFRGTAFDQRDYWKLVYSPAHHHFSRHFAVLFPTPIDGVCGLEFDKLEPNGEDIEPDAAYAIDCKLDRLAKLAIQKHTHTRVEARRPARTP